MTPEDDFPTANNKLKSLLRSKAPWETGDDEKQEPDARASLTTTEGMLEAMLYPEGTDRPIDPVEHRKELANDARICIATLRAERDRLDRACNRLFDALSWINDADPQVVADAEHKFGFNIHSSTVENETTHTDGDEEMADLDDTDEKQEPYVVDVDAVGEDGCKATVERWTTPPKSRKTIPMVTKASYDALRAERDRLREALKPFDEVFAPFAGDPVDAYPDVPDDERIWPYIGYIGLRFGDIRRARAALSSKGDDQ